MSHRRLVLQENENILIYEFYRTYVRTIICKTKYMLFIKKY